MLLQSQQNETGRSLDSSWYDACNISMRHSKRQAIAQTTLSDKFSLGSAARSPKEDVMKRNVIGILSLVVMSLMLNAAAQAQSAVKANVPFAFNVGSAQLPAGTYLIHTLGASAIEIRNGQTSASALSLVRREYQNSSSAKLVFHHVADQYFLAEIWKGAGTNGMVIAPSKQEKSLERELRLATGESKSEDVLIALN
jgi:hypothetical protein